MRMWSIAKAYELGMSVEEVHQLTSIDRVRSSLKSMDYSELREHSELLREAKRCGFADRQIAAVLRAKDEVLPISPPLRAKDEVLGADPYTGGRVKETHVRYLRKKLGIVPMVKQIDTLAAEFPAETNYLYLTYSGEEHDIQLAGLGEEAAGGLSKDFEPLGVTRFSSPQRSAERAPEGSPKDGEGVPSSRIVVLGCGPYRIGSSVEFDWCSVSCVKTLRSLGHEAIIINCNPETVSTDFDESDRLYFEELSHETVLDIAEMERPAGVVVSVGGQTPNNLAWGLHQNGVKILGTSVDAIDTCENRFKFSKLCDALRIDQPEWSEFTTVDEAFHFVKRAGFPVLVRPSYVLSGAAMRVVGTNEELERFLSTAAVVSRDYPVVISKYVSGAKEVELDAVGQHGELLNYAIAEHVENAGVHSGDASLLLPAQKLFVETHRRVKAIGQKICRALQISGPFNVQFMCKENEVMVIECNLRASRSLPFISKTYNTNFVAMATRIMLGIPQRPVTIQPMDMECISAKVPTFSFSRLKNSDPRLGVEMQSTGEVACFGVNQYEAFLKAMISAGFKLPTKTVLVSIGPAMQKVEFAQYARMLVDMGFTVYGTKNTAELLKAQDIACTPVYKPFVRREPNVITMLKTGKLDLVINVPDSMDSQGLSDGFEIRRGAVDSGTPLLVDIKTAILVVMCLRRKFLREQSGKAFWDYSSWQEHTEPREAVTVAGLA